MELELKRVALRDTYTIGKLYINGKYFCDTIEDTYRDLSKVAKVPNKTAIPYGRYKVSMNVKSPKYSDYTRYKWAKEFDGYLPRLSNVPNFDGILIHVGNDENDTSGCLIVGENKVKGKVINSTVTFQKLMREYLLKTKKNNEEIWITIK